MRLLRLCVLTLLVAHTGRAQSPATVAVHVHVTDSVGAPVAGAEVSVVHDLTAVLARGTTNERGDETLTIARETGEKDLVVRKIGFVRVDRFFRDVSQAGFAVRLVRVVQSLSAVKVTADEDVRRKSYFIDAEGIENSNRTIVDALDVVTKLRPDMIWGRRGQPDRIGLHGNAAGYRATAPSPRQTAAQGAKYGYCPPVQDVWVNGERQQFVPTNPTAARRLTGDAVLIGPLISTVLASIRPEHIQEIAYHPCTDVIEGTPVHSTNAIFVTLKSGIGFDPVVGSYLAMSPSPSAVAPVRAVSMPRLIGVFDLATGQVIEDAEVVDVGSGTFMRTSATGTATLTFLSADAKEISIRKAGYEPLTMAIPHDTASLTVVLTPQKVKSPHGPLI